MPRFQRVCVARETVNKQCALVIPDDKRHMIEDLRVSAQVLINERARVSCGIPRAAPYYLCHVREGQMTLRAHW